MSARAKKRSALFGVAGFVTAVGSGAWLWLDAAQAQSGPAEAPPIAECAVVAAGVAMLDPDGGNAIVGQPAIGVAGGGGITAHFGAVHCLTESCGPKLLAVCPTLPSPKQNRYIFPYAPSVALSNPDKLRFVDILFDSDVSLVGSICITSTGGAAPAVAAVNPLGGGLYQLTLDAPVEVGEWTVVQMTVANECAGSNICVYLGWMPGDGNQDGQMSLADATAFGIEFNGAQTAKLVDFNGDGGVSLADATKFGQIKTGSSGEHDPADGLGWLGKGLPRLPACVCP